MEPIKLLREEYGTECMDESMIHKWHLAFLTNLNEVLLRKKKDGWLPMRITKTNINTVWTVIVDDRHLSTRAIVALLYIPGMVIHCILTEKLEMVRVASTWVLRMLISDRT